MLAAGHLILGPGRIHTGPNGGKGAQLPEIQAKAAQKRRQKGVTAGKRRRRGDGDKETPAAVGWSKTNRLVFAGGAVQPDWR